MQKFNSSISIDKRMWKEDIQGSLVYVIELEKMGIVTKPELAQLTEGLKAIHVEWATGVFVIQPTDEDIHTAVERRLTELLGPVVAGKLHTGRSRNDQVCLDTRLYLLSASRSLYGQLSSLLSVMSSLALSWIDVKSCSYTHLQKAQPIRLSHWLLSHAYPLVRDLDRLSNSLPRCGVSPLGSGACAGHAFGLDRVSYSSRLGLFGPSGPSTSNSLDAVCDRDFVLEFLTVVGTLAVHLSQFAEDVILMNLRGECKLSEMYTTGSSLMPQKKNPDALELLRGKGGVAIGRVAGFMSVLKGLPRSYNKDLQEDKKILFDSIDDSSDCVGIMTGVLETITINRDVIERGLTVDMLATDLAEYLVSKGGSFREAHHTVGKVVRTAEDRGIAINEIDLQTLKTLDERFDEDVKQVWDFERSVERKNSKGGTSKRSVMEQIEEIRGVVSNAESNISLWKSWEK